MISHSLPYFFHWIALLDWQAKVELIQFISQSLLVPSVQEETFFSCFGQVEIGFMENAQEYRNFRGREVEL